ncbi:H+/nucleoside cotransporter [Rasamsonia emersonii CBS 393.64]|uniref:H+/nucleoside cotransporter n=1 Tax=Rasamsonia emersonii (strain ATCC 16479 / CBS 393.64 / IMI 116815) TaxID=1408163 RepID=A0A0F4YZK2_RASE3|nr:H+/nucleoside cotransporter [Rasamsonia emersonii CBS 393.64]KKA23073.1 H+/nucleoside cotransporter [Rasamsonia emersonii CBS 393.64]
MAEDNKTSDIASSDAVAVEERRSDHHAHHNHTAFAEKGREDEVVYTQGTTFDKSTSSDPSPQVHPPFQEKGQGNTDVEDLGEGLAKRPWQRRLIKQWRHVAHAVVWLLFTGWWIAGLILHRYDLGWLIPFLLYLAITLRILFFYVPITIVTVPMHFVWNHTARPFARAIPQKLRTPASAALVIAVIIIGAFASPESADNTRANRAVSLFGLVVLIFVLWLTSRDRKKIVWHTVIVGMLVQFIVALFVLRTKAGYDIFNFISTLARDLLGFANQGVEFLTTTPIPQSISSWFLVTVIPAIIFFVSIVQLLYYIGALQWFIGKFAVFFFWSMRVSGAEAVVAAASPFIGQGESAMLIKPFVPHLTIAELHQVMCSGFATIAGSVLIAYVAMGVNPQALVSSCVMSIPASLAVSKMRWPETEETLTSGRVIIPDDEDHRATNALEAFANGAWLGLKIAGMIGATLLCIISLIGLCNGLLTWWGHYLNINEPPLTIQMIVGYICYPIAFLLGVPRNGDLYKVAQLIGLKLITTDAQYADMSDRSKLIVTYALCGFANIGSLGNQIGVLAQIAPGRSGDVARVAVSAMLTGALSTLTSASIAGLLITDQRQFFASKTSS